MKRSALVAAVAFLAGALLVTILTNWRCAGRRPVPPVGATPSPDRKVEPAVLARLAKIPLYGSLLPATAIRAGRLDGDDVLHLEVDLRAVLRPRFSAMGLAGASELFPATAKGTIDPGGGRESWTFDGPAPALDLLDRSPGAPPASQALKSIPGTPSSLVNVRLSPGRLADPALGGDALAPWRDRASFAEKLLGRPLRAEIAEDVSGPAVFALYEGSDDTQAEAVLAVELRRSDRLVELVEMLFGLGALTERAKVVRYRGVSTGSFVPSTGGPGLALAVDGPILLVASSRSRLESAIDARRDDAHPPTSLSVPEPPGASWSAVSSSAFVRHGWARLARATNELEEGPVAATTASLHPEGVSGWRLDGHGPAPAITADPVVPYLRSVLGKRQR